MPPHRAGQNQVSEAGLNFNSGQRGQRNGQNHQGNDDAQIEVASANNAVERQHAGHRRAENGAHGRRQQGGDLLIVVGAV